MGTGHSTKQLTLTMKYKTLNLENNQRRLLNVREKILF